MFWIAASTADIPTDNPNGIKTLLANGVSTLFINGKLAIINGLRKFNNPTLSLVIFLVVLLLKFHYFLKSQLLSSDIFLHSLLELFLSL